MKNIFLIIFSVVIMTFLSSCRYYILSYKTLKLKKLNPTSYVFHAPIDSVLSVLNAWAANPDAYMETYDNPIETIYKDYEGHDYYCVISRLDQGISPVHLNKMGGGLRIYIEHRILTCDSIGPSETKINVIYSKAKLIRGDCRVIICPRGVFLEKPIPSSTILEYKLLRFIGDRLGEKDMPPLQYPKRLKEEDFKGLTRHLRY